MKPVIVQKYGGTSVGSVSRIAAVAANVETAVRAHKSVVVVVSAMAGETDRLLELINAINPEGSERESDVVVSSGEQVTAGLLALALQQRGVAATSLLAHQVPIISDGVHARARINWVARERIESHLQAGSVVVIPGFQAVDETGNVTTLGRGGSDTSAVAIAAALDASSCEIYTDVDGIYTTDPNMCQAARKIERMEYEELLEMAGAGAKVVQMRSVQLAARYKLPLHVRSAMETSIPGTCVVAEDPRMEATLVSGITATRHEAKIAVRGVPDGAGLAAQIFEPLSKVHINVDMIVQTTHDNGESDIGFTVAKEDLRRAMQMTENAAREIHARTVEAAGDVSKVSIVGLGMRSHAGVAARLFEILAQEKINIQLISTSEIKVSVVVAMADAERAVAALHHGFGLEATSAVS